MISSILKLFNKSYLHITDDYNFKLTITLSNIFIQNILDNIVFFSHYDAYELMRKISYDIMGNLQINARFILLPNSIKIIIDTHNNDDYTTTAILSILVVLIIERNLNLSDNEIIKIINTEILFLRLQNRKNGAYRAWRRSCELINQVSINQNPINQESINQESINQESINQELINQNPTNQNLILIPIYFILYYIIN
jgi:hypothetical protein